MGTKKQQTCERCSRQSPQLRRKMCCACYLREHRGHTVDGDCAVCGVSDVRMLRRHRLGEDGEEMVSLCANHAAVAGRRKMTLRQLIAELSPGRDDRRNLESRRAGDRRKPAPRRASFEPRLDEQRDDTERRASRRAPTG